MTGLMAGLKSYLVVLLDGQRYAIPPDVVERVLREEPVTRLPDSPVWLLGLLRYSDRVLPVLSLRLLMGLPERSLDRDSHFVVARLLGSRVILAVDEVEGLSDSPERDLVPIESLPTSCLVEAVTRDANGLLLLVRTSDHFRGEE